MTGRQIPSEVWLRQASGFDTETFMEEAGLTKPTTQSTLCCVCVHEGNLAAPEAIIFIKGTSLCIEHSKNMLN